MTYLDRYFYCKICYRPSEDRMGTYNGIPVQYTCECGHTSYDYEVFNSKDYDKIDKKYKERYLKFLRTKKLERICDNQ